MNILILNWRDPKNPKAGGAEIVTLEHAKAWATAGHRVTWFTSSFNKAKKEEFIEGVRIVRRGNAYANYFFAPFFYFTSGKYDKVIDEIHGIPYFTPLYVPKKKIIAFIHEVAGEIWDYMYPFPVNKIGKFFEKLYFKIYKNILFWTVSESTKKDLLMMGVKKIVVIANGLHVKRLSIKVSKETHPTFIFVSRIVKMKGVEDVIRAFKIIHEKDSHSKLWIIGDGEKKYVDKLKFLVAALELSSSVNFWGRVSEDKKLELMGRAHLLLHTSVKEGWGLVVLEAASLGTPSVVYNVGGLRDSVINDKTGIVVAKNTPEALYNSAIILYNNKKKYLAMQKHALKWAYFHSWEKALFKSTELVKKYGK